jgi:hypothetical protein
MRLSRPESAVKSADAEGWFRFDVPIVLPLIGRLVCYRDSLALLP